MSHTLCHGFMGQTIENLENKSYCLSEIICVISGSDGRMWSGESDFPRLYQALLRQDVSV